MEKTKRLTHQELTEPDQVTTLLDHAFDWVQKHPRALAGFAAGLIVLGIAIASVLHLRRSSEESASKALGIVVETAERSVGAPPAEPVSPRPPKPSFPDAAARDNAIIQEADAMLSAHGSSRAARGARMLKAQALARRGRFQEAADLYAQVAGNAPTDAMGAAAVLARAQARAALQETDAAVEDLKRLAASGNPHLPKDLALQTAAALVEGGGQNEVAAKLYQRIVDEVPDSPLVPEARAKAQELSAKKAAVKP